MKEFSNQASRAKQQNETSKWSIIFGYKTDLKIRKICTYNSKNIFFLNSRGYAFTKENLIK